MAWTLSGVVLIADEPAELLVRILESETGAFVAEAMSDPDDGTFFFDSDIDPDTLYDAYAINPDYSPGGALIFTNVSPVETETGDAHRYWKVHAVVCDGTNLLEISELQFLEGGINVTAEGTFIGDVPPFGGWTNLSDNNLTTRSFYSDVTGKAMTLDFGAGNEKAIDGIKQGGFDTATRYMKEFTLSWSDNNSSWTPLGTKTGLTYPGNNTLSALYSF